MPFRIYEANLAFYHIPKTGGSSVLEALRRLGYSIDGIHCPGSHTRHAIPSQVESFQAWSLKSFACVRRPLDWYLSWWRYANGPTWKSVQDGIWYPQKNFPSPIGREFNAWLQDMLDNHPSFVTRLYEWYFGPEGSDRKFEALRIENIEEELPALFDRVNLPWNEKMKRKCAEYLRQKVNASVIDAPAVDGDLRAEVERSECEVVRRWYLV